MCLHHQLIGTNNLSATNILRYRSYEIILCFIIITNKLCYCRRPLQRPNLNRKGDNRKNSQAKATGSGKPTKKGSNSTPTQPNTGRSNKRSTMNGNGESSQGKDDEQKEEEPAEEEKKFEASNHMEGDLVDILGNNWLSSRFNVHFIWIEWSINRLPYFYRTWYSPKESKYSLGRYCRLDRSKASAWRGCCVANVDARLFQS